MSEAFELKKINEDRKGLEHKMHELATRASSEQRAFTPEEMKDFDSWDSAQEELRSKAETIERCNRAALLKETKLEEQEVRSYYVKKQDEYAPTPKDESLAFRAWALSAGGHPEKVTSKMLDAANRCKVNLGQVEFCTRAQSSDVAGEGGNLMHGAQVIDLESRISTFGGVRSVAQTISTPGNQTLRWPTLNNTGNSASIISTQNSSVSNVSLTFSTVDVAAFTYATACFPVSIELLEDAAVSVEAVISDALGEQIARGQSAHFCRGNGSTQPQGYVTGSTAYTLNLDGSDAPYALTYDMLVDVEHSVDAAYRQGAVWVMHDAVLGACKKLTDSGGQPLWNINVAASSPGTLLGYPIVIDNNLDDDFNQNSEPLAFGNFKKFLIRDAGASGVMVLRERYADTLSVGFFGHKRSDSAVLQPVAISVLSII